MGLLLLSVEGNATGISDTDTVLTLCPSNRGEFVSPSQLQNEVVMHPLSCPSLAFMCPLLEEKGLWGAEIKEEQGLAGQVGMCSPGADKLCNCSPSIPEDLLSSCILSRAREMLWSRVRDAEGLSD